MKKQIGILFTILLLSVPLGSAVQESGFRPIMGEYQTCILSIIEGKQIKREMALSEIQDLIDMGGSCKEDFLTILDKSKSEEEVAIAFENIKPFFQALIDNNLTEKTTDELTALYYRIRGSIQEQKRQLISKPHDGPQPLAIWNGLPTPLWANMMCGQFDVGFCSGFAGGTHLLIPTIGVDAFLTYAFEGTSVSVGGFGYTLATAGFLFVIGFIGILIVTPFIMIGPYFLAGMSGLLFGVGV